MPALRMFTAAAPAILFTLLASAAGRGDPISAQLFNHRTLLVDAAGGATIPCFDRSTLPVVRVPRRAAEGLRVYVSDGKRSNLARVTTDYRAEHALLRVAAGAEQLDGLGKVELSNGERVVSSWRVKWTVPIEELPELQAARAHRLAKRFDDARAALEPALASRSPWLKLWAEVERGNIDFMEGSRESARRFWLDAAKAAIDAGAPTEATRRLRAAAFIESDRGGYFAAEPLLARAEEIDRRYGDERGLAMNAYQRGLLNRRLGELLAAHRELRSAADTMWRTGLDFDWQEATLVLALALLDLGRYRQALAIVAEPPDNDKKSTQYARYLANRAWVTLAAMMADEIPRDLSVPRRDYEEALAIQEERGSPQNVANAAARLAFIALVEGDVDRAESRLAQLESKNEETLGAVRWFSRLVRARVSIARGQYEKAEAELRAIEIGARKEVGGKATEDACTARMLLGDSLARRGQIAAAIDQYREALRETEVLARRLEIPRSRARYMFKHAGLPEAFATLLLRAGRPREALWVLDRERAIALEDTEANVLVERMPEKWREYLRVRSVLEDRMARGCADAAPSERDACRSEIDEAELAAERALESFYAAGDRPPSRETKPEEWFARLSGALARDEALLSVYRTGDDWVAFVLFDGKLVWEKSEAPPRRWLERTKTLAHIYVVLGDRTSGFEPGQIFDERGAPLASRISMSWLPSAGTLVHDAPPAVGTPLFIADPDTTLPETRAVARELAQRFPHASVLAGEQATRDAVVGAWSGRSIVHFSGHGTMRDDDPSTTRLGLALDGSLGIEDVLTERPQIGLAVLDGCTTGARPLHGDLGLPHAFLASGTRSVLATVREVRAGETAGFVRRFYEAGGAGRPAAAFREAVALSIAARDSSWAAFRLWGRR